MTKTSIQSVFLHEGYFGNTARICLDRDKKESIELILPLDDFSFREGKTDRYLDADSLNASDLDIILKCLCDSWLEICSTRRKANRWSNVKIDKFEVECGRAILISFYNRKSNKECMTMRFYGQVPKDAENAITTATQIVIDRLREAGNEIGEELEKLQENESTQEDTAELKM